MSGALIPQAKLQDVTFTECKLDGANFRMSEADRILFDHVNLCVPSSPLHASHRRVFLTVT